MPIYEYQCEKCEHQFDTLQKLSDKPLKKCPECGKMALTKLVSAAGFRLKGGGWYETDFKSGNKKNLAKSDTSDSSGGSGSSGNTDSGKSSSSASSSDKPSKGKGDSTKKAASASKKSSSKGD